MSDTTSEPWVGNSPPGAPVNASMSGSFRATRVEPWNTLYPTPDDSQGMGIFLYLSPNQKGGKHYGKRKPVHL